MKVSLVTIHANPKFTPLAALHLKAYLVQQGTLPLEAVRIHEYVKRDAVATIVDEVLAAEPEIVGLSCYVWNVRLLMEVAAQLRARRPELLIVAGGPEVGPQAGAVMQKHPALDAIVLSEGELVFDALVRARRDGSDLSTVKGVCVRAGGTIVDTGPADILDDLDLLGSPYLLPDFDATGRIICLETQRGCVFRCNFCFYNKDFSIRNRRFDLDRVKEELRYWLEKEIDELYLMDPIFNLNAVRAKEICRFIAEHNTRGIPFHTEVWAEFIDEEMARQMRDANFQFVEVGLQTTEAGVLAGVERRLNMDKFLAGIGFLHQYDVPFELQLIYGLPGETPETFRASFEFAASLKPNRLSAFLLQILPGTELWKKAEALGITYDPEPPYFVRSHATMSRADIDFGDRLDLAMTNFGNLWTMRLLAQAEGSSLPQLVFGWLDFIGTTPVPEAGADVEGLKRFVADYCASRGIDARFFVTSLDTEFAALDARGSPATA